MEVSVNVGYFGPHISSEKSLIKELDEIGISCIWTAEAYGYDAVTPLSYFAALTDKLDLGSGIMQIPGRSPAMTAMTAATLDKLSKVLLPDAKLSIAKTIESIANEKAKKLNGKIKKT